MAKLPMAPPLLVAALAATAGHQGPQAITIVILDAFYNLQQYKYSYKSNCLKKG
jgi:hypothetical protein